MKFHTITTEPKFVAELIKDSFFISTIEDGVNLAGTAYFEQIDHLIVHQESFTNDFFDLKSGIAGEILQKFSNFRIRLSFIGDFTKYQSKSLNDFIYESNRLNHITFVGKIEDIQF